MGPPRNGPHDIRRCRTRRHRQHRASRFRQSRWSPQQMDRRDPTCTPKQRVAPAWRLGRSRIALRRLYLQRRLELCQLTRRLSDAALLALLARFGTAAAFWTSYAFWRQRWFSRYTCGARALPCLVPAGKCRRRRWDAHAGDGACDGIVGAGTWDALLWKFPAYAPITVGWPCGSPSAEGYGEER